eukprot:TRINITY_DN27536_c0_g1_i1.p1 TRINITY_DN27536_c0_g1~~TRINITY_DN27536_c0_g1_i1.p1  ORF type:complete len:502 (+),score=68.40 TRINITY_DN27536_c0_g1_i1:214-1506(+)
MPALPSTQPLEHLQNHASPALAPQTVPAGHYVMPFGPCTRFLWGRCRNKNCRYEHDVEAASANAAKAAALKSIPDSRSTASSRGVWEKAKKANDAKDDDGHAVSSTSPSLSESWRSVDFLLRGESVRKNPYLEEFASSPWLPTLLAAPECRNLFNIKGRSLRKELTEAYGVLRACMRGLRKLREHTTRVIGGNIRAGVDDAVVAEDKAFVEGGNDRIGVDFDESGVVSAAHAAVSVAVHAVVVDLCCGKGFSSLLLALSLPQARILAVDKNRSMDLTHFRLAPNLDFEELDIIAPGAAEARLKAAAIEADTLGVPLLIVGMHLCGALSARAAALFTSLPSPPVNGMCLVLVPCCLDGRRPKVKSLARRLRIDPYRYWCTSLLFEVHGADGPRSHTRRELLVDDNVLSAKNTFIVASRMITLAAAEQLACS